VSEGEQHAGRQEFRAHTAPRFEPDQAEVIAVEHAAAHELVSHVGAMRIERSALTAAGATRVP